jgi:hypothetical protein
VALALTVAAITTAAVTAAVTSINADAEDTPMEALPTAEEVVKQEPMAEPVQLVYETPLWAEEPEPIAQEVTEDPEEPEKIEQALVEQGYLHEEIPLNFDLQCHLITVCEEYGVPYHIALGVIQAESSFTADASNGTCFGYMQINKINAEWLSESIGVTDLTDPYQNLRSGVFILSNLFRDYGDWHKALIAYNYGPSGAQEHVFSKGYTTTGYSRAVMEYADAWLEVVGE